MTNEMTLTTLAAEINTLHEAANDAAATALHYAARCGAKLNEAKASLPHGEFTGWVEANCRVTPQQSRKYMKLANEMPQLIDSKRNQGFVFDSIKAAIAYLSASEETQAKVDESAEPVTERQIKQWESELQKAQGRIKEDSEKIKQLSLDLEGVEAELRNRPTVERIVNPPDYEAAKKALVDLQKEKSQLEAKAYEAERLAKEAKAQVEVIERAKAKAIREGVKAELEKVEDQLKRAEAQEAIYKERSEKAKREYEIISGRNAATQRRLTALEKVRHALVTISAELFDVVDDGYDLTDQEIKVWSDAARQLADGNQVINQWLNGETK